MNTTQDVSTNQQDIDEYIKTTYNVTVPLVIFNYTETNDNGIPLPSNCRLDTDDLREMFRNFGEISYLETKGKKGLILFKNFIDAFTSIEFLKNSENIKPEHSDSYEIRWYNPSEDNEYVSEWMMDKISSVLTGAIVDNIKSTIMTNTSQGKPKVANSDHVESSWPSSYQDYNNRNIGYRFCNNPFIYNRNVMNYQNNLGYMPFGVREYQNMVMLNQQWGYNQYNMAKQNTNMNYNINHDNTLSSGKYTCKFFVQIENDFEFKVARRLIGAKGCNMKKIIDSCSKGWNNQTINEAVKLRLRGKGSGYKEGQYNQESSEPLHLCVSSKYLDKYKWACSLIEELLMNIYDDYQRFCERNGKTRNVNLKVEKVENVSAKCNNVESNHNFGM